MARIPLHLRTLILLPLLAAGVDLTRATAACGSRAQTCLEAAGRGWLGPVAILLVLAFAVATAHVLVRRATRPRDEVAFLRLWAMATTGVTVACTGQALLARALGDDGSLGGSPAGVLALCVIAGLVLALALRVSDRVGQMRVRAPRAPSEPEPEYIYVRADHDPVVPPRGGTHRGRAPPAL